MVRNCTASPSLAYARQKFDQVFSDLPDNHGFAAYALTLYAGEQPGRAMLQFYYALVRVCSGQSTPSALQNYWPILVALLLYTPTNPSAPTILRGHYR